jgi:hypothetical protein
LKTNHPLFLKTPVFSLVLLCSSVALSAQNYTGFRGGVNYSLTEIGVGKAAAEVEQIVTEGRNNDGWHFGVFNRSYFFDKTHFFQFEGLFNQSSFTLFGPNEFEFDMRQSAAELNGLFGFELLRFIRLQGGFSGRFTFNESYRDTFDPFRWGYLLGTGFTLGWLNADLCYNAAFSPVEGMFQAVPLRHQHSQVMLNIGIMF